VSVSAARVTEQLAEQVVRSDHVFPRGVLDLATACVIDGVGNMLAGSAQPVGRLVRDFADAWGGRPAAVVLGSGLRTSPASAALCNGTFHRALDYDNVWFPLDHPVAASLAALVTLGLGGIARLSGRQLVECLVIGMETQGRLRIAAESATHRAGAKGRGIFGTLAATAACCRALGLSARDTVMAFGIAAGRAGGVDNSGTMANPADSGLAARNGVESALLAAMGFTAREGIIEAASGFGQYLGQDADLASIARTFGSPWRLAQLGVAFKKYPCQYPTHWGIDAVRAALREASAEYDAVESLELIITPTPGHSSFNERSVTNAAPESGLAGKFSVPYTAAAALRSGTVTIDTFADETARSPEMADALRRVRVTLAPPIARFDEMRAEAILSLRGGRSARGSVGRPHGIWGDPLTTEELMRKFDDCAARALPPDRVTALGHRLAAILAEPDIRALADLMVVPGTGTGAAA
jgi:aconitate decarboxylase